MHQSEFNDWCPYKKERLGHGKSHMRTQQEGGHLQIVGRGLRRKQCCQHLHLGFLALTRTMRNKFLLFKSPSLQYSAVASQEPIQSPGMEALKSGKISESLAANTPRSWECWPWMGFQVDHQKQHPLQQARSRHKKRGQMLESPKGRAVHCSEL